MLLARRIDWEGLNTEFGADYKDAVVGQPPKATRLIPDNSRVKVKGVARFQ